MDRFRGYRVSGLPPTTAAAGWLLLLIYLTSFMGRAGLLMPAPLDNWHYIYVRGLMRWSDGANQLLRSGENIALYTGVEAFVLGLIVPAALFGLCRRRSPAALGLRLPNQLGWRWTLAGAALSVPVGLWITGLVPPTGSNTQYAINMLGMLPEHFMIFGIGIALLLPECRLPQPSPSVGDRDAGRSFMIRPRNFLKFGSELSKGSLLERLALTPTSLLAILGSTALFVFIHVGAQPVEVAFSGVIGFYFAYVTWRTGSIWPAFLIHWSLNLAPMGLRGLFG